LKEFSIAEACANALAKALTESESELSTILRENSILKAKVDVLETENRRIRCENKELGEQMTVMDKELNTLQSEIETYQYRQTNCDKLVKKCKAATKSYKSKVNEFKAQIANGGHAVPADTYKIAVEASNVLKKSLKKKELQVQHLTERIYNLERIIKKKHFGESSYPHSESSKPNKSNINVAAEDSSRSSSYQRVKGRAALLEKMQKVQSGVKGPSPHQKRNVLKAYNNVSRTSRPSSTFVSAGKENM
jgi:predicted RNase H-like nuclease (RuvC/YqgF family)